MGHIFSLLVTVSLPLFRLVYSFSLILFLYFYIRGWRQKKEVGGG